jgi:regulator of sirC expression with transglutaminase-like and TPR domain
MSVLRQILNGAIPESYTGDLATAALEIAEVQYPGLDPGPWIERLDAFGREAARRAADRHDAAERLSAVVDYVFGELGFQGNDGSYYDPRNSCLHEVIDRRQGIPITLSVLFMEIGRRAGLAVYGVGLPSHFVAEFESGDFQCYIDCFHSGRLMTASDCYELVQARAGITERNPEMLRRATLKQILYRMLANLRGIYVNGADWKRSLAVVDLMLLAEPGDSAGWRLRGGVQLGAGNRKAAIADLERYLEMEPQAADRQEVEERIRLIKRKLASSN